MVILEEVEYLHYVGEVKRKKVNLLTKMILLFTIITVSFTFYTLLKSLQPRQLRLAVDSCRFYSRW